MVIIEIWEKYLCFAYVSAKLQIKWDQYLLHLQLRKKIWLRFQWFYALIMTGSMKKMWSINIAFLINSWKMLQQFYFASVHFVEHLYFFKQIYGERPQQMRKKTRFCNLWMVAKLTQNFIVGFYLCTNMPLKFERKWIGWFCSKWTPKLYCRLFVFSNLPYKFLFLHFYTLV